VRLRARSNQKPPDWPRAAGLAASHIAVSAPSAGVRSLRRITVQNPGNDDRTAGVSAHRCIEFTPIP
jgi:hypothetical protein